MKKYFCLSLSTPLEEVWSVHGRSFDKNKEFRELYASFDVVQIWKAYFEEKYGRLKGMTHHSNPDDPPDVMAHFSGGDLPIEHTMIEPAHMMKAEALHRQHGNGRGCFGVPVSATQNDKAYLLNQLYNPQNPWEQYDDALKVRFETIYRAVETKVKKYPPGGLMVLEGNFIYTRVNEKAIELIFDELQHIPGVDKWIIAFIQRNNGIQYFSTLYSKSIGLSKSLR